MVKRRLRSTQGPPLARSAMETRPAVKQRIQTNPRKRRALARPGRLLAPTWQPKKAPPKATHQQSPLPKALDPAAPCPVKASRQAINPPPSILPSENHADRPRAVKIVLRIFGGMAKA